MPQQQILELVSSSGPFCVTDPTWPCLLRPAQPGPARGLTCRGTGAPNPIGAGRTQERRRLILSVMHVHMLLCCTYAVVRTHLPARNQKGICNFRLIPRCPVILPSLFCIKQRRILLLPAPSVRSRERRCLDRGSARDPAPSAPSPASARTPIAAACPIPSTDAQEQPCPLEP
jgi:hypothetical protein